MWLPKKTSPRKAGRTPKSKWTGFKDKGIHYGSVKQGAGTTTDGPTCRKNLGDPESTGMISGK